MANWSRNFLVLVFLLQALIGTLAEEGSKRSAEQLLTRVMRNDFLIRALRSPSRKDFDEEVSERMITKLITDNLQEKRYEDDFLARAMRSSDFYSRSMRNPAFQEALRSAAAKQERNTRGGMANQYLVRTM